jgi:hypothetical protein
MKPTDIPNGFVILGQANLPVLIDFDDNGVPIQSGIELKSGGWLDKGGIKSNVLALVHTVKGEEEMLIKALLVVCLNQLEDNRPVTAVELGKANKLYGTAKSIRDKYVAEITRREKDPTSPITNSFKILNEEIAKTSKR